MDSVAGFLHRRRPAHQRLRREDGEQVLPRACGMIRSVFGTTFYSTPDRFGISTWFSYNSTVGRVIAKGILPDQANSNAKS